MSSVYGKAGCRPPGLPSAGTDVVVWEAGVGASAFRRVVYSPGFLLW